MGKFFGTDGIRGVPWNYPFTEDFISRIAYCAASALTRHRKPEDGVPSIFIGMDTRASAQKIRKYLCEGFRAACGKAGRPKVVNIGIIPTPAISYIVQKEKADFGVVISASHNPPEFNGIKFFGPDGRKLNDELEQEIENMLLSEQPVKFRKAFPQMAKKDFSSEYIDFLLSTLPEGFNLKGVKLVVDCANGAATKIAPKVFEKLGAETVFVGNHPNGNNINIRCGALHTDRIAEATPSAHAFCGISLDGDADRCLFCDECGNKMDGDDVIAAVAPFLKEDALPRGGALPGGPSRGRGVSFRDQRGRGGLSGRIPAPVRHSLSRLWQRQQRHRPDAGGVLHLLRRSRLGGRV